MRATFRQRIASPQSLAKEPASTALGRMVFQTLAFSTDNSFRLPPGSSMRSSFVAAAITAATVLTLSDPVRALSFIGTQEPPAQAEPIETHRTTPLTQDTFVTKNSLPALTEAMLRNRQSRDMLMSLIARETDTEDHRDTVKALDTRFAILSAVGDRLVKATTTDEVAEASAAAQALLALRTELDRKVSDTQQYLIGEALRARAEEDDQALSEHDDHRPR